MRISLTDGGGLSSSLCTQLKDYGLSLHPSTTICRHLMYNGQVVLGEKITLQGCKLDSYSCMSKFASLNLCSIGRYSTIGVHSEIGLITHNMAAFSSSYCLTAENARNFGLPEIKRPSQVTARMHGEFVPQVTIGHDVTVEPYVIMPKAVTIGHGAIIRANTVVTKDVPPYAIVAAGSRGSQVVGTRFSDEIIADLLELSWWDYDLPTMLIQGIVIPFHDIKAFISLFSFAKQENFPRLSDKWLYLMRESQDKVNLYEVSPDCQRLTLFPRHGTEQFISAVQAEMKRQMLYQQQRQLFHLPSKVNGPYGITLTT